MSPRNTTTGGVLEAMVLPALQKGGYSCQSQQKIGERFGGGAHFVDVIAVKDNLERFSHLYRNAIAAVADVVRTFRRREELERDRHQ